MLAYLAGLFDGEGCITRSGSVYRLQVAMTHEGVISWLGEMGGTVRERRVQEGYKRCWIWLLMRQRDVQALLLAMRPYLRVKDAGADAALARLDEILDA